MMFLRAVAIAVLASALVPAILAQDPSVAAYTASAKANCIKLKQERDELAQKAAHFTAASPQKQQELQKNVETLNALVEYTEKMIATPPKTAGDIEAHSNQIHNLMQAAKMAASDVKGDMGMPRTRIELAIPEDLKNLANQWIKEAKTKNGDIHAKPDTDFFRIRANQLNPANVNGSFKATDAQDANQIKSRDKGKVEGGVMLEGVAVNLPPIDPKRVQYDASLNALVLGDAVYFSKTKPWVLAALCRAIAVDNHELVGVSLTAPTYTVVGEGGNLYRDTALGRDLALGDGFLRDIVFLEGHWETGYKRPNDFVPKVSTARSATLIVRWSFRDYRFRTSKDGEIQLAGANVEARVMPVTIAKDGGFEPDLNQITKGFKPPAEYVANAENVARHFNDFYIHELLLARILAYGADASILRSMKKAGVNLETLARDIADQRS